MAEREWETRRDGEQTVNYLGRVLEWVTADGGGGLGDMPRRAREGHFDDYFCPPDVDDGMNMQRLVAELRDRSRKLGPEARRRAGLIVDSVMDGEFDGTKAESDRWAASKEGQDLMAELARSSAGPKPTGGPSFVPNTVLDRLGQAALEAIENHPEYVEGEHRAVAFIDGPKMGSTAMLGFDESERGADAVATMLTHLQAVFAANGRTLKILGVDDD